PPPPSSTLFPYTTLFRSGRELVKSLDDAQRKVAVITNTAPSDIITSNARKAKRLEPAGLPVGKMNEQQREILHALVEEYVARNRSEEHTSELQSRRDLVC